MLCYKPTTNLYHHFNKSTTKKQRIEDKMRVKKQLQSIRRFLHNYNRT